ncbi:MAG: hypothetical protein QNJ72_41475, partial [Pleurocapsa sp. MO_226.B13]|nr:hypothetical protein [Pleurocapsa sp. MO_226.B13]
LTISGSGKIIITGAALEFPADYEYTLTPEFRFTDVFAKTKLQGDETSGNKLIFNNLSDLDLTYLGLIRVETQFNDSEKVKIDFVAVEEARPGASYDFGFGSCNEPEISYTKGRVIFSECFKPEFSNLLADLDSQTRARFNKCWGSASSGGIPHSYSGNGLPLIEYEECEGLILSGKIHYESPTISAPLVRVENCTRLSLSFSGQNTNTTGGEVVFTPFNSDLENSYLVYLVNSDVELNLNSPTSQSTYITGGGAIYADSRSQIDTRRGSGLDLIFYDSEGKLITSLLPSDEEVILESGSFLNSFDFKDEEGLYTLNSAAVLEELAAKDLPPILDGEEINLYLDPTAGDDANSGMDSALPVKTWAAITALAQKYRLDGGRLRIDVAAGTHAVDETWEINDDFIAGEGQIFLTGVQPSFEDLEYVFVPSFRILNFTLNTFLEFSDNNKIIVSKDGVVVDSLSLNNGLEARNCENFTATTLEVKSSVFCNNCKNPFARDLKLTEAGNNQADLVFIRCFDPYFENIIGTTSNEISFQFCEGDVKKSSGITIAEHPASTVATAVSYSNCKNLVLEGNFYLKGSNLRGKLINLLNSENIELDLSSYVNESGGDITFAPSGVATPQQQSLISIINSSVSYRLTQLPTDFFIKGFNSLYIDESSKVSGFNLVFDPQTSSYSTDRIPGDGRVVREIGSIIDGKDYQQSDGSFILQESAIARLDERVSNTIFESTGFLALQVSEAGDDANDGLTFPTAVRTLTRAKEIINSEYNCADSSVLILLADSVFNLDETLVIDSSWKCRSLTIIGQTLKWSDGVSSACILIDNNLEGTAGDSLVEPRGSTPLVILEDFTLEPPSTGNVMGLRVENGSRAIVNRVKFQQNNLFHLFVRHSKVYSYDGFSFDGEARTGIYLLKDSEINIFDAIAVNGTQNYSSEFLRVRDNSKFRCLTSTVFNTGATVTGKKYNFESQSEAYFKTDDPQYDTLEKLIPGDLAGTIAPNCIVNGDRLETSNAIAQLAVKAEQIPRIQSGIQQVSAAGTVQTNITFPQQFATVPNVQVTLITDGSGTFTDRGLVLEGEPTTTGFTVKGVGNVTALDKISWIAIAN